MTPLSTWRPRTWIILLILTVIVTAFVTLRVHEYNRQRKYPCDSCQIADHASPSLSNPTTAVPTVAQVIRQPKICRKLLAEIGHVRQPVMPDACQVSWVSN